MAIPAHERLLDLIIALTQTRVAMSRAQIRESVNGYAPDDGTKQSTVAFERMFERDKETLKEMGVPLITVHGTGHFEDIGYRIDTKDYRLPPVQFTPAELGAVALASQVWDGSVLARYARRGLTKLRGVVSEPAQSLESPVIRPHEPDEAMPVVLQALANRSPISFTYVAASTGERTARTVEPWRILAKHHGWYVWGWDRDREAPREFRLSRIEGRVRELEESFVGGEPQPYSPLEDMLTAEIAIRPEAAAGLRVAGEHIGNHGEWDLYRLPVIDMPAFAGDVAAYGEDVLAVAPPELITMVVDKLRGAVAVGEGMAP